MKTGRIYVALEVTPDGWRCSFSDGKEVYHESYRYDKKNDEVCLVSESPDLDRIHESRANLREFYNIIDGMCILDVMKALQKQQSLLTTPKPTVRDWVIAFLKGKDFVSPTVIGKAHAAQFGYSNTHHSSWTSRICLKLVKEGILERNSKGHYRLLG